MIKVLNTKWYRGLTFGDYQKLPGVSHSDIRIKMGLLKPDQQPTEKMSFGVKVHNYLLEPEKYEHESIEVKKAAIAVKEELGVLYQWLEKEVAITADFEHVGLTMPYRGRIDLAIKGRIIVDAKIINGKDVRDTMDWLGYNNAQTGYCLASGAKIAIIVAYSTKTRQTQVVKVEQNPVWWEEQIILNAI